MFAYNLLQIYSLNIIAVWILLLCTVLIKKIMVFPLSGMVSTYLYIIQSSMLIGYNLLVKTAHLSYCLRESPHSSMPRRSPHSQDTSLPLVT